MLECRHSSLVTLFIMALVLFPSIAFAAVTANISNTNEPNQADDIRLGLHLVRNRNRYTANATSNLIGPGEFEEFDGGTAIAWTTFQFDGQWNTSTPSGVTYSKDSTAGNFVHGKSSQKIQVSSLSSPFSFGQFQSYKEFLQNHTYRFSCYLKQQGMTDNVRLRIRYLCPSLVDESQEFTVTTAWQRYAFEFTMPQNCAPKDPAESSGSSTRIDMYGTGTLWVDSCELVDVDDHTDWGLSERFIEAVKKLRPSTLRWGGLDANPVQKKNILLSNRFDTGTYKGFGQQPSGSVPLSLNQYLKLNDLVGSNPQFVLSQRFTMQDHGDFLDYLFKDDSTEYGAKRKAMGYSPWTNTFDKWYLELGNELLLCGSIACQEFSEPQYADWSTERINFFKGSANPEAGKTLVGFNVWTSIGPAGRPEQAKDTFLEEKANSGGGNADFFLVQGYYGKKTSVADDFYNEVLGQSALSEAEDRFHNALSAQFYGRQLPWGYYEYGNEGEKTSGSTQWNLQTSLGFGLSLFDESINLRKHGAILLGAFFLNGVRAAWGFMDDYPVEKKRPVYYLYELYGSHVRGKFITHTLSGDITTFDPFGPGADQTRTIPQNPTGYPSEPYPVDVPHIAVYPFKKDNRYSFVVINRSLTDTIPVSLSLPYSPSSTAFLHYVTASSPTVNNEGAEQAVVQHQTISDFADSYTLSVRPFSAYVIVNYVDGTTVCLDDDGDGYGANPLELADCSGSTTAVDCDDSNPRIYPTNSNSFCDCDKSGDGYYIGGIEFVDGIDNSCDGIVDDLDGERPPDGCPDSDGDGFESFFCGGLDCDDSDPDIKPGATEVCFDDADNDCNGLVDCDDLVCSDLPACEDVGGCTSSADCPQGEICCSLTCQTPVCSGDLDCSAGETCQNAGTCSAECVSIPPCGEGLVTEQCVCGTTTVTTGYCCEQVPSTIECSERPSCASDQECLEGQVCCNSFCVEPFCTQDSDCSEGETCQFAGTCQANCVELPPCSTDSDCSAGEICCLSACTQALCSSDADCSQGYECTNAGECNARCVLMPLKSMVITTPEFLVDGEEFTVIVIDEETLQPLQGARVKYSSQTATTGAEGKATLTAKKNTFLIIVEKQGYQKGVIKLLVKRAGSPPSDTPTSTNGGQLPPESIVLEILDEEIFIGERFSVKVQDGEGNPISDVTVKYGSQEVLTNSEGIAALVGKKNLTRITATKNSQTKVVTVVPKTKPEQPLEPITPDGQQQPGELDLFDLGTIVLIALVASIVLTIAISRVYYKLKRRKKLE